MAMTTKDRTHAIAAVLISAVVVVGAATGTSLIKGLQNDRDQYRAGALRPRPTTTVTAPTVAPRKQRTQPTESGSTTAISGGGSAPEPQPQGQEQVRGSSSGSSPTHSMRGSTKPSARCTGGRLISVSLPVGLLPCNAVSVGGSQ